MGSGAANIYASEVGSGSGDDCDDATAETSNIQHRNIVARLWIVAWWWYLGTGYHKAGWVGGEW